MNNLSVFKLLFCLLSVLILTLFLLFIVLPYLRFIVNGPAWYVYSLAFIAFYLVYCILSCTSLLRGWLLVISGILMHLGLAAFTLVIAIKTGNAFFTLVSTVFAVLWTILCIARLRNEARS